MIGRELWHGNLQQETFPSPHRDPITKGGELNKVDTTAHMDTASRSCLAQPTVIPNQNAH
ncbi:hypothetical protein QWZ16_08820 [Vibrio ostreicida]|uniref:Uncharacterized protein n=1 Tax=Vibrio ostreicida TaxID=526588 RepID=A0ABT8BTM5_9VIBR|nr:hypothetical protein [Vibrio ostreicida]MDN3609799.1 hypothetical protein [Vibrio ostreicida]